MNSKIEFTYIDLFAGCGGLSLGLYNAGWKGLFAVEKNPDAFKTLKHNLLLKNHFSWPNWLPKTHLEIDEVLSNYKDQLSKLRGKVDLVAGGPPCQGFSTAGKRNETDVRNGLIKSYLRFIMLVRPKTIFFENVKGFTLKFEKNKSKGVAYSQYVLRVLKFLGYHVESKIVDFSKYGLPQKRTRFIIVGVRKDVVEANKLQVNLFFNQLNKRKKNFLNTRNLPQNPNLRNAISDLLKGNGVVATPDRKAFFSGQYSSPQSKYQKYLRLNCELKIPNSHSFTKHKPEIEKRFRYFIKKTRLE